MTKFGKNYEEILSIFKPNFANVSGSFFTKFDRNFEITAQEILGILFFSLKKKLFKFSDKHTRNFQFVYEILSTLLFQRGL